MSKEDLLETKLSHFVSKLNHSFFDSSICVITKGSIRDMDDLVIKFIKNFDLIEDKEFYLCDLLSFNYSLLNSFLQEIDRIPFKYPKDKFYFKVDNVTFFNEHRLPDNDLCKIIETYLYTYTNSIINFFRKLGKNCY